MRIFRERPKGLEGTRIWVEVALATLIACALIATYILAFGNGRDQLDQTVVIYPAQ
jgi:hypothetical protein